MKGSLFAFNVQLHETSSQLSRSRVRLDLNHHQVGYRFTVASLFVAILCEKFYHLNCYTDNQRWNNMRSSSDDQSRVPSNVPNQRLANDLLGLLKNCVIQYHSHINPGTIWYGIVFYDGVRILIFEPQLDINK